MNGNECRLVAGISSFAFQVFMPTAEYEHDLGAQVSRSSASSPCQALLAVAYL